MYAFDPGFQIEESYTWFYNVFRLINIGIALIIIGFICYFITKIWIKWPTLLQRHQICFTFSFYFIITFAICILLVNFLLALISENEAMNFESSRKTIWFTCLANLYVITLQYMYSLSREGEIGNLFF